MSLKGLSSWLSKLLHSFSWNVQFGSDAHTIVSQILVLYLKLSLLQAKKVSENQKKLLFKKNRLSTAASIFLIIQLFKWFSSALASSSPHLGYFQKSNLSSKDKITLEKSQYLFDSIYFVMIANFLNESHYSLPLCRWEYYPMLRISVIKALKVHPWNFHLKMVDSVSPVWACCWIEVTVTQMAFQTFFPHWIKKGSSRDSLFHWLGILTQGPRELSSSRMELMLFTWLVWGMNSLSYLPAPLPLSQHDSTLEN